MTTPAVAGPAQSPLRTPPSSLTWARLARLEPQLAALLVEARAVDPGDNPHFCANRVWYREFSRGSCTWWAGE